MVIKFIYPLSPLVTRGSQLLPGLDNGVSLRVDKWQKHSVVTSLEALCILGIDYLRKDTLRTQEDSDGPLV